MGRYLVDRELREAERRALDGGDVDRRRLFQERLRSGAACGCHSIHCAHIWCEDDELASHPSCEGVADVVLVSRYLSHVSQGARHRLLVCVDCLVPSAYLSSGTWVEE